MANIAATEGISISYRANRAVLAEQNLLFVSMGASHCGKVTLGMTVLIVVAIVSSNDEGGHAFSTAYERSGSFDRYQHCRSPTVPLRLPKQ